MIYRVTLPNGETLHTGHGPLADVWLNRHGGKLERIPLASIKSVAAEMWDGSPLTAALISVDRLRAILNDKDGQMDAMFKELGAWLICQDPRTGSVVQAFDLNQSGKQVI